MNVRNTSRRTSPEAGRRTSPGLPGSGVGSGARVSRRRAVLPSIAAAGLLLLYLVGITPQGVRADTYVTYPGGIGSGTNMRLVVWQGFLVNGQGAVGRMTVSFSTSPDGTLWNIGWACQGQPDLFIAGSSRATDAQVDLPYTFAANRTCKFYVQYAGQFSVVASSVVIASPDPSSGWIPPAPSPSGSVALPSQSATPSASVQSSYSPVPSTCFQSIPPDYYGPPAPTNCPTPSPSATPPACPDTFTHTYTGGYSDASAGCARSGDYLHFSYTFVPLAGQGGEGDYGLECSIRDNGGNQIAWLGWLNMGSTKTGGFYATAGVTGNIHAYCHGAYDLSIRGGSLTLSWTGDSTPSPSPSASASSGDASPSGSAYICGWQSQAPGAYGPPAPSYCYDTSGGTTSSGGGTVVGPGGVGNTGSCQAPGADASAIAQWTGCIFGQVGGGIVDGILGGLKGLFVPGNSTRTAVGSFVQQVEGKAPFGYVSQVSGWLGATSADGGGSCSSLNFTLAGTSVAVCTALTNATGAIAPWRPVLFVLVAVIGVIGLWRAVLGGLGASGGGGEG